MNQFEPFVMERMMSKYEQGVDYNLSESGVHPMLLSELLEFEPDLLSELLKTEINYPHVNGIPELRQNIAAFYEGASADNVLVTVGAIEANYLVMRSLLNAGDECVVMLPNYMQVPGIAKNHGLKLKTFSLLEDQAWAPDLEALKKTVSAKTKLIAVCNPNNPTGRILRSEEMDEIVRIADSVGAWILADEVYAGAEREQQVCTESFFGRYSKVLAVGSMSKAYGLPGLRLGWVLGPQNVLDELWARHEYVALSATMLSNKLAALALSPQVRPKILERTRTFIRNGYPVLKDWMDTQHNTLSLTPPGAAAIAFIRYHFEVNSTEFCERLRTDKSVLIVPGDHFGLDQHLRISYGLPKEYLIRALERIHELVLEVA